jgi:predicted regulator of Ras-like GTPase activity (Roadblock/LC7/MglB family)
MSTETCIAALKNTLDEIKNACPEVSNAFVFRKDKKILAEDENTGETAISNTVDALSALNERAKANGSVESVILQGTNKNMMIMRVNDLYFAIVASNEADEKSLKIINHVLVPNILKMVEAIQPGLTIATTEPARSNNGTDASVGNIESFEPSSYAENAVMNKAEPGLFLPEPPVSQCMVGNLSGFGNLLGSQDIVRVDSTIIAHWKNLYGDKKIEEVQVEETRTGKRMRCKFKPLKDQKLEGKGIIQMPEKAQLTLQTKKGALVMVKPVIE